MVEGDPAGMYEAATAGMPRRLRVGIADRDSGFVQTLVKRLPGVAMEPVLAVTVDPEALIPQRLEALVLDVETIGDSYWPDVERLCERLPALAVVVCTGRSSVAQRVRGCDSASMPGSLSHATPKSSSVSSARFFAAIGEASSQRTTGRSPRASSRSAPIAIRRMWGKAASS
jgi:hypothetical protein